MKLIGWRPLNGWRAFAGEIGVVTLGVLIALVAQQIAQEIDWRNRANGARVALRREVADHYRFAVEHRMTEPCVEAQLDRLERLILAGGARLRPAPSFTEDGFRYVIRVPSRNYVDAAWQGVLAEGVSSHLNGDERARLAEQYSVAALANGRDLQFDTLSSRLEAMSKPLALDPGVRLALLTTIAELRNLNGLLGLIGGQVVDSIGRLRMTPPPAETRAWLAGSGTRRFCAAQALPLRSFAETLRPMGG